MGLLKFAAKAVGTVVLTATGTASAIGEAFLNIAGNQDNELVGFVSEAFGSGKSASFNAIRNMWSDETVDSAVEKVEGINATALAKKQMADTARRMAQQAKKSGNTEKYDEYIEKYNEYMDEYNIMRAEDAYRKAEEAADTGDMEKYDEYMEEHDMYEGRIKE